MRESSHQIDPLYGEREMNLKELVNHYTKNELPRKAHSTQEVYGSYLKTWIVPAWGNLNLSVIKPVPVETWLGTLPVENSTRAGRNRQAGRLAHTPAHDGNDAGRTGYSGQADSGNASPR
jgi:hypothetical protein